MKMLMRMKLLVSDCRGQDLIEYALMVGFVALACVSMIPGITSSINVVFSKINTLMVSAAAS